MFGSYGFEKLKGSYDVVKNNIIWCNARFTQFKVQKNIIFHIPYIIVDPLPHLSETCKFIQSSSFWKMQCALIGQLSSVLWLAKC